MSEMIVIPGEVVGITGKKDRTWKVSIDTPELNPDTVGKLGQLLHRFVYCALKPEDFRSDEIEAVDNLKADYDDHGKSPSQRLRGVLYILYS